MSTSFVSESGLRPIAAFVVVGAIVLTVAGKVVERCWGSPAQAATRIQVNSVDSPEFGLEDRNGVSLACSVPRFLITGSARRLWHAHTPERIVAVLGDALPELSDDELYRRLLPAAKTPAGIELQPDWILASTSEFELAPSRALQFDQWLHDDLRADAEGLIGFRLVEVPRADGQGNVYRVAWRPREVLSEQVRNAKDLHSAWSWARVLCNQLIKVLDGSESPLATAEQWQKRREEIWRALFPVDEALVFEDLGPERVHAVEAALASEKVSTWQLGISHNRFRGYAAGELDVVGHWGFTDTHNESPIPLSGLERLAARMLSEDVWSFLEGDGSTYRYRVDRAVRGGRANAYLGFEESAGPVVVQSTIDLELQRYLAQRLDRLQTEQNPALTSAMVVDIESGEVVAIDSVTKFPCAFFPPVYHAFTPGSTFKILTMAVALENGLVDPDEELDVGQGRWRVVDPNKPNRDRHISEAKNAPTGVHPVRHFFAKSVNAAFVQIGLRVPDTVFREFLTDLGYGARPDAGLGGERLCVVDPLPWDSVYTHASISFGHQIETTLWQHATGLTTVLRGGEWKPLTMIRGVRQGERFFDGPERRTKRVLSESTCATVKSLMREGIDYGTGRNLKIDGVDMGSKTGTTEKVVGEVCAHVAFAPGYVPPHFDATGDSRGRLVEEWMRERSPHKTCYTSSICLWGEHPQTGRALAVLVVVDEVENIDHYYGGQIAGPVARDVLIEALGLTRGGETVETIPVAVRTHEVSEQLTDELNVYEAPWRGGAR